MTSKQSVNKIRPVGAILQKKRFYQKILQKLRPEILCLQRIKDNLYWNMKFFKQATYIRYVLIKPSKFVQISTLASADSFLQMIPWKLKRIRASFQATFFLEFFDKKNYFVILLKLAKCHYQSVVKRVSYFMLRHLIMSRR